MIKSNTKNKRSKLQIILIAPLLAIIFLVGWTLYNIGEPNHKLKQKPAKVTVRSQEELELMAIPTEKQAIPTN
jgi:hypothetical protein